MVKFGSGEREEKFMDVIGNVWYVVNMCKVDLSNPILAHNYFEEGELLNIFSVLPSTAPTNFSRNQASNSRTFNDLLYNHRKFYFTLY